MSYPTLSAWLHTATERVPVPLINDPAVYDAHCKSKGGVCFIAFLPDEDWELGLEMMRRVAERVWVTPNIINGQFTTQPLPIQFAWAQADHQLAVRDAIRLQNAPGMLAINAVKNVFTTCVLALAACVPAARCRLWQHPGHAAIPPPHCLTRAVLRYWCPPPGTRARLLRARCGSLSSTRCCTRTTWWRSTTRCQRSGTPRAPSSPRAVPGVVPRMLWLTRGRHPPSLALALGRTVEDPEVRAARLKAERKARRAKRSKKKKGKKKRKSKKKGKKKAKAASDEL